MPPLTTTQIVHALTRGSTKLVEPSLATKVAQLRQTRSTDPVQELQSQVIVGLYDAVRQIQEAVWPILATIPDVSAVRDAAAKTTVQPTTHSRVRR
jgi:hypothetical protein